METLQFIPGCDKKFYEFLTNSQEPSVQRILQWSQPNSAYKDSPYIFLNDAAESLSFSQLNFHVEELPECPGIFVAYSVAKQISWRNFPGIPIA